MAYSLFHRLVITLSSVCVQFPLKVQNRTDNLDSLYYSLLTPWWCFHQWGHFVEDLNLKFKENINHSILLHKQWRKKFIIICIILVTKSIKLTNVIWNSLYVTGWLFFFVFYKSNWAHSDPASETGVPIGWWVFTIPYFIFCISHKEKVSMVLIGILIY